MNKKPLFPPHLGEMDTPALVGNMRLLAERRASCDTSSITADEISRFWKPVDQFAAELAARGIFDYPTAGGAA